MRISLLFITSFLAQIVFGQDTYYKSSIVTLKNDTIKGFISNIYDAKNIKFKAKKNDKPTIYTPQQLRGFTLDGNIFETKIVNIPFYKVQTVTLLDVESRLIKDEQKKRIRDTVFLHKLVKGTANCYKMSNTDGFTYFFIEKNGVLKELPPQYSILSVDTNAMASMINRMRAGANIYSSFNSYAYVQEDYLDTLAYMLNDKKFITMPSKTFKHSEKSLRSYIELYNKRTGIASGGLLKTKVSRKIFTGISVGTLYLQYDDIITDEKIQNPLIFKLYGIYPLSGSNRNIFAKFGLNHFSYNNDSYKRSVQSATFGLRYSSISGAVRPYLEGSLGVALLNINNRPQRVDYPLILEGGLNIPVKNFFITAGVSLTPVIAPSLNGYKLAAFNVGVLF
jgi:hypothetical protein